MSKVIFVWAAENPFTCNPAMTRKYPERADWQIGHDRSDSRIGKESSFEKRKKTSREPSRRRKDSPRLGSWRALLAYLHGERYFNVTQKEIMSRQLFWLVSIAATSPRGSKPCRMLTKNSLESLLSQSTWLKLPHVLHCVRTFVVPLFCSKVRLCVSILKKRGLHPPE